MPYRSINAIIRETDFTYPSKSSLAFCQRDHWKSTIWWAPYLTLNVKEIVILHRTADPDFPHKVLPSATSGLTWNWLRHHFESTLFTRRKLRVTWVHANILLFVFNNCLVMITHPINLRHLIFIFSHFPLFFFFFFGLKHFQYFA